MILILIYIFGVESLKFILKTYTVTNYATVLLLFDLCWSAWDM